jgi:DNA-binding PadR family transcriptional regulator
MSESEGDRVTYPTTAQADTEGSTPNTGKTVDTEDLAEFLQLPGADRKLLLAITAEIEDTGSPVSGGAIKTKVADLSDESETSYSYKTLERLEKKGWVQSEDHDVDDRVSNYWLTPKTEASLQSFVRFISTLESAVRQPQKPTV